MVSTGEGATAQAEVQVYAKRTGTDKEPVLISEHKITIGGNTESKIVVAARELAHDEKDSVYIVIPNANAPDIMAAVFVVLSNTRYSTEPERG